MKQYLLPKWTSAVLLSLWLTMPQPALALELFGKCIIGECKADAEDFSELIDPRFYSADFVIESEKQKVIDALYASSELWRNREKPVAGSAGLLARAKGDYRRMLAALYDNGRYAGVISIKIDGQEAVAIPAGTTIPQNATVSIRVDPGQPYLFGKTSIVNAAPPAFDPDDSVTSPEDSGFARGNLAEARTIRRAGKLAVEAWRQQGHALAKLDSREIKAIHPSLELDARLNLKPGPKAFYDTATISGAQRMDPEFVRYMTGLVPGQEYDPDDLARAKKRLDRLGVFASHKFEEGEALSSNGLLPINLAVQERKLRRIGLGATVSSLDGAGIESYWLHRNLFGKAESLRLDAKLGGLGGTFDPEELDYLFSATFKQPGLFTPDTDLTSNIFAKQEFNDTFRERSAGGSADVTHYWSDRLTLKAGAFAKYGEFDDAFGTRNFLTTGLRGEATYDSRNNKLDATRGFFANMKAVPFYEWEFGNAAAQLEAEGRTYFAFDDRKRSVFAVRAKVGSLLSAPLSQTPASFLFTAGGGNSVRGFAFKSIGIDQLNGETSGGLSLFETSVEFRQRIGKSFGAVAFADAGTVGSDSLIDFSEDMKIGVGLGLRYYTGLGPIRLDFAVPLNPGSNDPDFAFYAGIGHAF